ncbi:MAG: Na+/H+ antiporter subunit E [Chloroflexi bacterium]|nr:Na+/H+ antiporter subunit E [Chloroflexota bacterium]
MRHRNWVSLGVQTALLFAFWLVLSGRYEPRFLIVGALSVALVLLLNRDIFVLHTVPESGGGHWAVLALGWRWLLYVAWLLYDIAVANIQVASLVLHPRMPIDPVLLRFSVSWRRGATQVLLANSITLTPGTVTVDLRDGEYTVHTLAPRLAQPLVSGEVQKRVASVLGEEAGHAPAVTWIGSVGALEQ